MPDFDVMKAEFPWGLLFAVADAREVSGKGEWRRLIRDLDRSGGCVSSSYMHLGVQPVTETVQGWVADALAAYWEESFSALCEGWYDACFNFERRRLLPAVRSRVEALEREQGRCYSLMVSRPCFDFLIENAVRASLAVDEVRREAKAAGRKCRSRFNRKALLEITGLLDGEDMDGGSVKRLAEAMAANGGSVAEAYRGLRILPRISVAIKATDMVFEVLDENPKASPPSLADEVYRRIRAFEGLGPSEVEPKRLYRLIRNRLAVIAAVQRAAPKSKWASAAVAGLVEAYVNRKETV